MVTQMWGGASRVSFGLRISEKRSATTIIGAPSFEFWVPEGVEEGTPTNGIRVGGATMADAPKRVTQ